jgi:hypothetical protein
MAKRAARTIGSSVGREIVRGVLGSLLGGRRRYSLVTDATQSALAKAAPAAVVKTE